MMKDTTGNNIAALVSMCLRIADWSDNKENNNLILDTFGIGCRVLSTRLRNGVEAIIDLEKEYANVRDLRDLAVISEQDISEFLEDVFGVEEANSLNDDIKDRIREPIRKIVKDAIAEWEDENCQEV